MCDTFIATKLATEHGKSIFAKNSDRPPNEGQHLAYFSAQTYLANSRVKCTYIEIPQAQKTHAILLSKPFWIWGAEIGANEHGLVIGNEAVYSKIPANKTPALLGMDLLRLGLERAVTAREALQVIVDLLEEFGQGGTCEYEGELYYHNSFLIADPNDAWVLETVDKQWVARQVKDTYSISNCLTIGSQFDLSSANAVSLAVQKGFASSAQSFDFAKDYSDFIYTNFGKGHNRRAATKSEMQKSASIESMMKALRHHNDENFDPQNGIAAVDVCMHASFGPVRFSQSTASLVAYLDEDRPIIFATGTSAPCTSIFKPLWLDSASLFDFGPVPAAHADSQSLFWTHEKLHRATVLNYAERIKSYASDRDALEKKFIEGALKLNGASMQERADFTAQCFREAAQAEAEWLKRVEQIPAKAGYFHSKAWKDFNKKAQLSLA
jgi:dipeptidase